MSTAETAACLDLSEENVKIRLVRARKTLRDQLYARAGATSLEARLAQSSGMVLTEQQIRAMEKAKQEQEAHSEIETAHPGYLDAQEPSRALAGSMGRPSSIPIRKWHLVSSTIVRTSW